MAGCTGKEFRCQDLFKPVHVANGKWPICGHLWADTLDLVAELIGILFPRAEMSNERVGKRMEELSVKMVRLRVTIIRPA